MLETRLSIESTSRRQRRQPPRLRADAGEGQDVGRATFFANSKVTITVIADRTVQPGTRSAHAMLFYPIPYGLFFEMAKLPTDDILLKAMRKGLPVHSRR